MIRAAVLAAVCALAACSGGVEGERPPRSGAAVNSAAELRTRPLESPPTDRGVCRLPAAQTPRRPGGVLYTYFDARHPPSSPVTFGNLQAGGQTLFVDSGYLGPLLVRGGRLDPAGRPLLFFLVGGPEPPGITPVKTVDTGKLGGLVYYQEMDIPAAAAGRNAPRQFDFNLEVGEPGCQRIQIDGADFSLVVLFFAPGKAEADSSIVTSPDRVAGVLTQAVDRARPLLLPAAIPSDWTARVSARSDRFIVGYRMAGGDALFQVGAGPHELSRVGAAGSDGKRSFRGDGQAIYQVSLTTSTISGRDLVWTEPGTWSDGKPGVPYWLGAYGLTDDEFWALAASLR